MKLFARCQTDYQVAWSLQHRPFDEFDGVSLLQRANLDQKLFGTYVGAEYVPQNKRWRWRGRKATARNKIIGVLAQIIAGILFPTVYATDDQNNESRDCARCMRILVQEHLKRAGYGVKFIYMVLSALVNPATFVHVEYVQKMNSVKIRLASGEIKVEQAIDELLSGLALNVVPVDELLLGDFYTFEMQAQPYLVRVRRISYDVAKGIYARRFFDSIDGKEVDRFDNVQAGQTRALAATTEGAMLYDVEWTEGDQNMVQEATFYYRGEDLQVRFVGGVFMGFYDPNDADNSLYNGNPFDHRRMTQVGDAWGTMPVYPYAKSGYEPLDPSMRFAYYKSAAFKEFWDDATLNMAERLTVDGMHLDVVKPILISGIAKYDSNVMAPGAVASLPKDATVSPYQLGPNIAAAMQVLTKQSKDLEDSTIADILRGQTGGTQTAYEVNQAVVNAKRMMGVVGALTANLVEQIGELTVDCIITNTTVGEVQEMLPGALGMKFMTFIARSKDKGRDITHRIVFTDKYMGRVMSQEEKRARSWELWTEAGAGKKGSTKISEVNPYQFARRKYTCYVDSEEMIMRSTGTDRSLKDRALAVLTSPAVMPWTDQEAVINDFAIEEYGGNDPDRYKRKGESPDAMMALMGQMRPDGGAGTVDPGGKNVGLQKTI
jgi:glucose uptake protein GlcU